MGGFAAEFLIISNLGYRNMITKKSKKWDKNKSPVGWYVASVLLRFEFYDEDKTKLNRRCRAWVNEILIKAKTPEQAYKRALFWGKLGEGEDLTDEGRKGKWIFECLISLLPIYEKFEDGAEIAWEDYQNITVKRVKNWVRNKGKLEVFKDED